MKKYILSSVAVILFFVGGSAYGQQPTPTPSDADVDLMQRAQMVAEIKMLRAKNTGLEEQNNSLKSQIGTYEKLNVVQEARIADLKESIKERTTANDISTKVEDLYKVRINEYQAENMRLRAENDSLRKSRDRRSLIAGGIGIILGKLLL